jgi:hypothetical protein
VRGGLLAGELLLRIHHLVPNRRGVVASRRLGVELRAEQDNRADDPQEEEEDDRAGDSTIGLIERRPGEDRDVQPEEGAEDHDRECRDDRAGGDPLELLFNVRAFPVEDRQPQADTDNGTDESRDEEDHRPQGAEIEPVGDRAARGEEERPADQQDHQREGQPDRGQLRDDEIARLLDPIGPVERLHHRRDGGRGGVQREDRADEGTDRERAALRREDLLQHPAQRLGGVRVERAVKITGDVVEDIGDADRLPDQTGHRRQEDEERED